MFKHNRMSDSFVNGGCPCDELWSNSHRLIKCKRLPVRSIDRGGNANGRGRAAPPAG